MNHIAVTINGHTYEVEVLRAGEELQARITSIDEEAVDEAAVPVYIPMADKSVPPDWMIIEDRPYELLFDRDLRWVQAYSGRHPIDVRDLNVAVTRPVSGDGRVKAPIPGLIARLLVEQDDVVEPGAPLLILEAMKMENEIRAPRAGRVTRIGVAPGQTVVLNELMIEIE